MPRGRDPVGDDAVNSSVVIPVWVAASISAAPFSPAAATPAMSPFSSDAKGSFVCHSGCWGAIALTRSMAKKAWKYIGCSAHSVPSLSNTAMRSGSGTKSGEPAFVTRSTKATTAFFGAASFHEGSESTAAPGKALLPVWAQPSVADDSAMAPAPASTSTSRREAFTSMSMRVAGCLGMACLAVAG